MILLSGVILILQQSAYFREARQLIGIKCQILQIVSGQEGTAFKSSISDFLNMATLIVLRHPVTILVTAFTKTYNLTNDLSILKLLIIYITWLKVHALMLA